jgi:hypothetical protein
VNPKHFAKLLLRTAPCLTAGLLLTGCIGVVPTPITSKVEHGQRVKPEDVLFIQPGVTTRAEVIAKLGRDYAALPHERVIGYSWELEGGNLVCWAVVAGPGGEGGGANVIPLGGWRALFIAFDDAGRVRATAFKKPSLRKSLHEHMYVWEAKLGTASATSSSNAPSTASAPTLAGATGK